MIESPVRFASPEEGNNLYPLPPDYGDLTSSGKRTARVNAVSLQKTPEDLVWAWSFFRAEYLFPLRPGIWYSNKRLPSPPAHYKFVYDVGAYSRNIHVYLRSFAKSTLIDELNLLWACTRPYHSILLIKSMDDFVQASITKMMWQLEENEHLVEDFGKLRAPRSEVGMWTKRHLWLRNGFQIIGRSVMSKLPGFRPWMIWFDDAEYDPKMRISPTLLSQNLEAMITGDVVPMLDEGAALNLVGTLHTRKFFLYYAATVDDVEDPKFSFYNRTVMGGEQEGKPLWEEKFSPERLAQLRIELGPAAFAAQIMNDPGTEQDRVLVTHHKLNYYTVKDVDENYETRPLESTATLVSWVRKEGEDEFDKPKTVKVERPFGKTVSKMYRLLVADPIRKPSNRSDFACVMVIGIEHNDTYRDTWWPLDLKLGRVKESVFTEWIWEMGLKWAVRVCGIEAVAAQQKLYERIAGDFAERSIRVGWCPRVYPIRYVGDFKGDKSSRISRLAWRFEQHRIKYPRHLVESTKEWKALEFQTNNFTEDRHLLQHDDAIDTLAMPAFMVRPRGSYSNPSDGVETTDVMALLAQGERNFPGTNIPLLASINMSDLTPEAATALQSKRFKRKEESLQHRRKTKGIRRMSNVA